MSLEKRFNCHASKSKRRMIIKNAILKYGREVFVTELLYTAFDREDLNAKECEYIKQFNSIAPKGYNILSGGAGSPRPARTKRKISASKKGKCWSEARKYACLKKRQALEKNLVWEQKRIKALKALKCA